MIYDTFKFKVGDQVTDSLGAVGTVMGRDNLVGHGRLYVIRFSTRYESPDFDDFHGGSGLLPRTEDSLCPVKDVLHSFVDPAMA